MQITQVNASCPFQNLYEPVITTLLLISQETRHELDKRGDKPRCSFGGCWHVLAIEGGDKVCH
jgi:hypothetical protein